MWSSISDIQFPNTLPEAVELLRLEDSVLIAGGTYLAAERDAKITTLIDINPLLLDDTILADNGILRIGAGTTLQKLVELFDTTGHPYLAGAQISCPSKNIRNQRTIGGEWIRHRADSELVVMLEALDIRTEWEQEIILTGIEIDSEAFDTTALERFALLPSAPAFAIVAGVRRGDRVRIAIGGSARQIYTTTVDVDELQSDNTAAIAAIAGKHFCDDHVGSRRYKQSVIATGLQRVGEQL